MQHWHYHSYHPGCQTKGTKSSDSKPISLLDSIKIDWIPPYCLIIKGFKAVKKDLFTNIKVNS